MRENAYLRAALLANCRHEKLYSGVTNTEKQSILMKGKTLENKASVKII